MTMTWMSVSAPEQDGGRWEPYWGSYLRRDRLSRLRGSRLTHYRVRMYSILRIDNVTDSKDRYTLGRESNTNAAWCTVVASMLDRRASPSLQSGGRLLTFLATTNAVNPLIVVRMMRI
jgi:hypothetical protein